MITTTDEEDEKAKVLRRKLIKNIVEAKLKNERESERLGRRLGNLAKAEERELRNIQRNLDSLRRELQAIEPEKTSDNRLKVQSAVCTHVGDKGDFLTGASKREERLCQRRKSECSSRSPMSFLELRRLPSLPSTEEGLIVWPLPPVSHSKSTQFPASLHKQRKSFALPKIEVPENENVGRRKRFQSSPAALNYVSKKQLAAITKETSPKQHSPSGYEADEE